MFVLNKKFHFYFKAWKALDKYVGPFTYFVNFKGKLQGVPKTMGIQWHNWISSLLWIIIVMPSFKSHNIIMSATVYFMKRVNDCKDVSIMSPQDEQWRRTSLLCLYTANFFFYNRLQSKYKQTKREHSRWNSYRLQLSLSVSLY